MKATADKLTKQALSINEEIAPYKAIFRDVETGGFYLGYFTRNGTMVALYYETPERLPIIDAFYDNDPQLPLPAIFIRKAIAYIRNCEYVR